MVPDLHECEGPCDAWSCLLFSALWLRCNQSLLVQETQSEKDTAMTSSEMLLIKATSCLRRGPMSLEWPVALFCHIRFSRSSLHPEVPSGEQQLGAFPPSLRSCWKHGALRAQPLIQQRTTGWDGCGLRCITCNTRVLVTRQKNRESKLNCHETFGPQRHHLSPRSAWKGRVSSSYPGTGSSIFWYFSS